MSANQTPPRDKQPVVQGITIPATPCLTRLGYGTGVGVYNFERSPKANKVRSPWAIKKVLKKDKKCEFSKRLEEEAIVLRKLVHPNIIGFRAFVKGTDGSACLAMEKCEASLSDIIEKRCEKCVGPLPPEKILKMTLHAARALDYLHNSAHLLHGDIKSGNILVQGDFQECKLCDFGVCLPLTKDGKLDLIRTPEAEYIGTDPWSAPEVLKYPQVVTSKADMFSLGITIWETLAVCTFPHCQDLAGEDSLDGSLQTTTELNDSDVSILEKSGPKFGTRPPLPDEFEYTAEFHNPLQLFFCCTLESPGHRPSAHHLSVVIDEMRNNSTK